MKDKAEKKKLSWRETIRIAWKPYRRLYSYVLPYKWRFFFGLFLGCLFGATSGILPIVMGKVTGTIFHGSTPNATSLAHRSELLNAGGSVNKSIFVTCLLIPAVMTARSLLSYGNTYYMNWVSNRAVTDIRNQLFSKIVNQSMDFFNRMQAGVLMSRISNNTAAMQMALAQVSSDVFKHPITIIFAFAVLIYMDWKFTFVALILFPSCIIPIQVFGKRARRAMQEQRVGLVDLVGLVFERNAGFDVEHDLGARHSLVDQSAPMHQAALIESPAQRWVEVAHDDERFAAEPLGIGNRVGMPPVVLAMAVAKCQAERVGRGVAGAVKG